METRKDGTKDEGAPVDAAHPTTAKTQARHTEVLSPRPLATATVPGFIQSGRSAVSIASDERPRTSSGVDPSYFPKNLPGSSSKHSATTASEISDTPAAALVSSVPGTLQSDYRRSASSARDDVAESVASNTTRDPSASVSAYPDYPNQALSSVHTRRTIRSSVSPYNDRAGSLSQSSFFPSNNSSPRLGTWKEPRHTWLPRTTGNTPAHTPGLFPFGSAANTVGYDGAGDRLPLPSPYLHPVQVPPPRTTRSAQRDIDFMSGRKMINRYEIIDELGRGVHGKVKLARNLETGEQVAIKIVQRYSKRRRLGKSALPEDKVKKEIAILKKVQHPNVVRLIEVIDDPDMTKVYIVLEFCEQKELIWRAEGFSHIVLMEYYQQESDANQASADDTNANIDEVKRIAARRKGRHARKRLEAIRAAKSTGFPDLWSLEYANDSDEGGSESEHEAEDKTVRNSPLNQTQSPSEQSATIGKVSAVASDDHEASKQEGYSFYSTEWYPDKGGVPSMAEIDEDLRRRRQASVAESASSQLTERMGSTVPLEFRYVPTMTLDECRTAIRDALVGLEYLHYNGIIHRDIKPENLLRTRDHRVKISDFGVSYLGKPIREDDDSANTSEAESADLEDEAAFAKTVGTPAFYAPELCRLDFDSDAPVVKHQVDIWALGITLYCLIYARVPFDAENEFALMKRIREDEIFIPRRRLRAIDPTAPVRSPGHAPLFQQSKRNPHDFQHEDVDDDLYDLLRRFFHKDPAKRITIKEIKHHPWIIQNIADFSSPSSWIEATDPSRVDHGRKIEVSSQELQEAVVPINSIIGRIKSISKRATSALGLGSRRKRGQSSASSEAGSSSTSINEQAHKDSHGGIKAFWDKESEHPLSRSVTASPDPEDERVQDSEPRLSTPANLLSVRDKTSYSVSARPAMPERHGSELSTTASIRTVRPSDYDHVRRSSSTPPSPEASAQPLGTILGGTRRKMLRSIASRDVSPHNNITALPPGVESRHGQSTAAFSNTSVSGQLEFPDDLHEKLSAIASPSGGFMASRDFATSGASTASLSHDSMRSRGEDSAGIRPQRPVYLAFARSHDERNVPSFQGSVKTEPVTRETAEEYRLAKDSLLRRRALNDIQTHEYAQARAPRRAESLEKALHCPPSPDDDDESRRVRRNKPLSASSEDPSETSHSRSTSFPSEPSAVSANSSIYSNMERQGSGKTDSANSSEGTTAAPIGGSDASLPRIESVSDSGYQGDGDGERGSTSFGMAPEDDDEDSEQSSSSEEDNFLTLNSRRKTQPRSTQSQGRRDAGGRGATPGTSTDPGTD